MSPKQDLHSDNTHWRGNMDKEISQGPIHIDEELQKINGFWERKIQYSPGM